MLTEAGYFWFGFVTYTAGVIMMTLSFKWFGKYSETKDERNLLIGGIELLGGFTLAIIVARILWEHTPLAEYLAH